MIGIRRFGAGQTAEGDPAAPGAVAIRAGGLVRRFGEVEALAGVSFAVTRGEFFSLLGPSGCGKTTLLRLIAGLDVPDAGTLEIGGRDAAGIPAHRRPVNTVFQSYALFPHMTVRENVAFGLRMRRVPAVEAAERVGRMLKSVEIEGLAERRPAQLSGGQKQRVALARAVVNEPEVLLLDEPLGALDFKLRKQLQVELHSLQRRLGLTFIYVTHDQEEALAMSDRIAVMRAGRIEQLDQAEALYEKPRNRFVAQFLGSCNLLPGTVVWVEGAAAGVETPVGILRCGLEQRPAKTGDRLTLAIRPEKIRLLPAGYAATTNRVVAKVEDAIYAGAETQYQLRAGASLLNVVTLNARSGGAGFRPGESAVCELAAESMVVLED